MESVGSDWDSLESHRQLPKKLVHAHLQIWPGDTERTPGGEGLEWLLPWNCLCSSLGAGYTDTEGLQQGRYPAGQGMSYRPEGQISCVQHYAEVANLRRPHTV